MYCTPRAVAPGSRSRLDVIAICSIAYPGRGFGGLLLAQALRDCWEAGKTFAFVAVILDCVGDAAKDFYRHWDFEEIPGQPYRLFLSAKRLDAMMEAP